MNTLLLVPCELVDAIIDEDFEKARRIIADLEDVDALLLRAVRHGLDFAAAFLIEEGADVNVNVEDAEGQTPLHIAVRSCENSIVKMLVDAGADRHKKNKEGKSPSDLADDFQEMYRLKLARMGDILNTLNT